MGSRRFADRVRHYRNVRIPADEPPPPAPVQPTDDEPSLSAIMAFVEPTKPARAAHRRFGEKRGSRSNNDRLARRSTSPFSFPELDHLPEVDLRDAGGCQAALFLPRPILPHLGRRVAPASIRSLDRGLRSGKPERVCSRPRETATGILPRQNRLRRISHYWWNKSRDTLCADLVLPFAMGTLSSSQQIQQRATARSC